MMIVKSGKEKSRIQYKRNGYLGSIGMAKSYLGSIDGRLLSIKEFIALGKVLQSLNQFEKLLRKNGGKGIKIEKDG